jgi:hypothetical protein
MDAGTLYGAIAEVCPVISTRVGVADDRATWSFEAGTEATPAQIDAGNNVCATIPVDYQPPPVAAPEQQVLYAHENRIRALEGQPPLTLADFVGKVSAGP